MAVQRELAVSNTRDKLIYRYLKEITKPRDLGTILKKVEGKEGKKYQTMQQLGEDIELVFNK
jgi:hypothetical protein